MECYFTKPFLALHSAYAQNLYAVYAKHILHYLATIPPSKVIVWKSTSNHNLLMHAKPGTAMHEVYYGQVHDDPAAQIRSRNGTGEIMALLCGCTNHYQRGCSEL
jgi:hypothetical protein